MKIYVPSEWGTDHRHLKYDNQMFANKQDHHAQAERLGMKVIAIYTGLIMETTFTKWLGMLPFAFHHSDCHHVDVLQDSIQRRGHGKQWVLATKPWP